MISSPNSPLKKPLVVLVSGAPGTGKTTLAALLAKKLGLYHVERDTLKLGIEFTSHTDPKDRKRTVVPVYWEVIFQLLALRISCIADGSHYRSESEPDLARFGDSATVLNIHCKATNHHQRVLQRTAAQSPDRPTWEKSYAPDLNAIYNRTLEPLDHGYATIVVDTADGYQPALPEVAYWIEQHLEY